MESTTIGARRASARRRLDARTACEGFQITARGAPDAVALRTKGDEFSMHLGRVRRARASASPPAWRRSASGAATRSR